MSAGVDAATWWEELVAAALVGTARRPVPPAGSVLPVAGREGASPEETLLDLAALGSALRRAGYGPRPPVGEPPALPDPASADALPVASPRARQLLDLLLGPSPVGPRLAAPALIAWLRAAAEAGVRAPHAHLVALLEQATATQELRPHVKPVLDARGAWLAARHQSWRWAAHAGGVAHAEVDPATWATWPTEQRAVHLRRLRGTDAAAGRALAESTLATDPVTARATLLSALEVGLSLDDEPLLERALDDRAGGVREAAHRLLDALPGSARAARMGARLAPLLGTTGLVRRRITVELPRDPDAGAVRDGLGPAPRGRSERGLWLQRLGAGAPLATWTDATGLDAGAVVRTLDEPDALAGLRAATVARGDVVWARALLARGWDAPLVARLPASEQAARVQARVEQVASVPDLTAALRLAPEPWSEATSRAVVARLARLERPPHALDELVPVLARGLHPSLAADVDALAAGEGPTHPLHQLATYLTLVPTLRGAFT